MRDLTRWLRTHVCTYFLNVNIQINRLKAERVPPNIQSNPTILHICAVTRMQGPRKIDKWGGTYSYIRIVHH